MSGESWVSVKGEAKYLNVAMDSVYHWIQHKALPAHKVSRLWQFKPSKVNPWVRVGGAESEGSANRVGEEQR